MNTATKSRLAGLPDGYNGQRATLATGNCYNPMIHSQTPFCQSPAHDVKAMIEQAQRLAFQHDQAAAEAARVLAHHTAAAARHRAILRELRGLAGRGSHV